MESHEIPNIQSQDLVKLKSKCNFEFGGGGGGVTSSLCPSPFTVKYKEKISDLSISEYQTRDQNKKKRLKDTT